MNIGFILFPNVIQLDFIGPLQVLHRMPGATMHILAKSPGPAPSDCGLSLVPTDTFTGAAAGHVTPVCDDAFLLGAAGLRDCRKATTYWALLPPVGATHASARWAKNGDT